MEADETPSDDLITKLHSELAIALERIAWSILRDWQLSADATQEAFLLLARKSEQIPPDRHKAWLVRTVQLQAHNLRRKQQKSPLAGKRPQPEPTRDGSRPAHDPRSTCFPNIADIARPQEVCPLEQAEELSRLQQAIESLPTEQQTIIRARLVEGETFAQIAEKLHLPLGTVLLRMRLALGKLRQQLRNENDDHSPTNP